MNLARTMAVLGTLAGSLLLQGNLGAGDKKAKEPDKKKSGPMKQVVVDDQWVNADLKDKQFGNSHFKSYTFKMEKDKSYQIDLSAGTSWAVLRLENSAGNQMASDFHPFTNNQPATIIYRS